MARVLILYTSIGLGHKTIAENFEYHLSRSGYEVKLFDALKVQEGVVVKYSEKVHSILYARFPFVWRWLYLTQWFTSLMLPLRVVAARFNSAEIEKKIREYDPDVVISTQTSPSAVIEYLKRSQKFKGTFFIAFSDYHLHRFWLYPSCDGYFINTQEQKEGMLSLGVLEDRIFVCGVTLKPKQSVQVEAVKESLSIPVHSKVVLVGSGSLGTGVDVDLLRELLKESERKQDMYVIVVCGKNTEYRRFLERELIHPHLRIVGYYSPMQELYAASDVFVTKPGGLTVAESLLYNLPLYINHWLPGQEELNIKYLSARGLVTVCINNREQLVQEILKELISGKKRVDLSQNVEIVRLVPDGGSGEVFVSAFRSLFTEDV